MDFFFRRLMNQSAVFVEWENNGVWHVLHQPTIDEMHEREAEREVFQIIKKRWKNCVKAMLNNENLFSCSTIESLWEVANVNENAMRKWMHPIAQTKPNAISNWIQLESVNVKRNSYQCRWVQKLSPEWKWHLMAVAIPTGRITTPSGSAPVKTLSVAMTTTTTPMAVEWWAMETTAWRVSDFWG